MENKIFAPQPEQPRQREREKHFQFSEQERVTLAKEFFGITEEELSAFKERIAQNQGHVRVFVHPFYISRHPEFYDNKVEMHEYAETDSQVAAEHLEEGFLRTVESVVKNEDGAPLIVFEDEDFVEQTRQDIIQRLGVESFDFAERGIVFSATGKSLRGGASGSPSLQEVSLAYQKIQDKETIDTIPHPSISSDDASTIYQTILSSLNIQSVTMGGTYFLEWNRAQDELGACAGNVRKMFNRLDIPVNLSRYNVTPREQLASHYHTKQTRDGIKGR